MRVLIIFFYSSVLLILVKTNVIPEGEEEEEEEDHHPYGRPISLMKFDDNETVVIDFDALDRTFLHPEVRDRKIVAVSIIGAFRKGKSFLMDYALRYMYANYKSVAFMDNPLNNKRKWIGDKEEPLKGFTWRGGANRDTTGVVLWSDVFLYEQKTKTKQPEKFAIVLMDTQGLFDTKTSATDNSRIFALGTLISSVQIFNLNNVIQENQLEYLQMATDFAKFALKKDNRGKSMNIYSKPFQTLIFLMRDWQNGDDFAYGHGGGARYIEDTLKTDDLKPEQNKEVRKFIKNAFEETACFLLPHPGKIVTDKNYDGRFSELDEDFQNELKNFLEWLLKPTELILKKKKILNVEVTGAEYSEYMKIYFEAFQSDELPRVETIHGLTVKKQYDTLISEAMSEYKAYLKSIDFKADESIDNSIEPTALTNAINEPAQDLKIKSSTALKNLTNLEAEMDQLHNDGLNAAVKLFKEKKKLGSEADERKYEAELKRQIEDFYVKWKNDQMRSYEKLKEFQDQERMNKEKMVAEFQKFITLVQVDAEKDKEELKKSHDDAMQMLEQTMDELKNKSSEEIKALADKYEADKKIADEQRQLMLAQLEEEKRKIAIEKNKSENTLKEQLEKLKKEIDEKEQLAKSQIEEKEKSQLEVLRLQAEERKAQHDRDMQIAGRQAEALAEQRKFELDQLVKLQEIRETTRLEAKKEREQAERERVEADRKFQKQLLDAQLQAQLEMQNAIKSQNDAYLELLKSKDAKKSESGGFFSSLFRGIGALFG